MAWTLQNAKNLNGCAVQATDGSAGRIDDFIVDDKEWRVRYIVVNTHPWWPGGQAILSTEAFQDPDWQNRRFPVNVTRTRIKEAPHPRLNTRVTRQEEAALHEYFSWLPYWSTAAQLGSAPSPGTAQTSAADRSAADEIRVRTREGRNHVYALDRLRGCVLQAEGEDVGYVDDAVIDLRNWGVRYLVSDSRRWLHGTRRLVLPQWTREIHCDGRRIDIDLPAGWIANSPAYDPSEPITPEQEESLATYYKEVTSDETSP